MDILARAFVFITKKFEEAYDQFDEAIDKAETWYDEQKNKDKPES